MTAFIGSYLGKLKRIEFEDKGCGKDLSYTIKSDFKTDTYEIFLLFDPVCFDLCLSDK
jgi:hypothetical protein